jgi:hypothetical protein
LLRRDLRRLASPDPFDPLVVDHPSGRRAKKLGDLPVAATSISASEFDDIGSRPLFVVSTAPDSALGRTMGIDRFDGGGSSR